MTVPKDLLKIIKEAMDVAKDEIMDIKKIANYEEFCDYADHFCGYSPENFLLIKTQEGETVGFLLMDNANHSFLLYMRNMPTILLGSSAYNIYYHPPEGLIVILVSIKNERLQQTLDSLTYDYQ